MYPTDTLGRHRRVPDSVGDHEGSGHTVEDNVLHVEELAHGVADPTESPEVDFFHDFHVVLDGGKVEEVKNKVVDEEPEGVAEQGAEKDLEPLRRPGNVVGFHLEKWRNKC